VICATPLDQSIFKAKVPVCGMECFSRLSERA
jgi:hypothetical protein